ncbi:hypothetical protein SAMN05216269_10258 [Flavobacterium xinjiangense]|uniref:Uncharacterized protein n=1 Tax=Flavobacterium xinjiangense TaxID=178356 RepID=A0A1M7F6W3_9FLAO|nr:hypothetical protein SAMN05216269_10258 [Flavobacterium xinjiangense]
MLVVDFIVFFDIVFFILNFNVSFFSLKKHIKSNLSIKNK